MLNNPDQSSPNPERSLPAPVASTVPQLTRRDFLKNALSAGVLLATGSMLAGEAQASPETGRSPGLGRLGFFILDRDDFGQWRPRLNEINLNQQPPFEHASDYVDALLSEHDLRTVELNFDSSHSSVLRLKVRGQLYSFSPTARPDDHILEAREAMIGPVHSRPSQFVGELDPTRYQPLYRLIEQGEHRQTSGKISVIHRFAPDHLILAEQLTDGDGRYWYWLINAQAVRGKWTIRRMGRVLSEGEKQIWRTVGKLPPGGDPKTNTRAFSGQFIPHSPVAWAPR